MMVSCRQRSLSSHAAVLRAVARPAPVVPAFLLVCGLLALSGCAGVSGGPETASAPPVAPDRWPAAGGAVSPVRESCTVLSGEGRPGGVFVFALNEEVLPGRAPVPHNASERIVFAHLYETLVTVDCAGEVTPGLAVTWACTEDSTTWVFTLREDARFWDGSRVTADDVRLAWTRNQADPACTEAASPWSWINAHASSITVLDTRRLAVQLPEPQARFPLLLAHPAAAVATRREGWTWPVGSGVCRLRASDPAPRPDLLCRPNEHHPRPPIWKSLTFRVFPGVDARDLAVKDIDLAYTRDLAAVAYFGATPGFDAVPLPFDRLYLLVCPPLTNPAGAADWLQAAARLDVARDVTGVATRPWSHAMFPLDGGGPCPQLSGPIASRRAAPVDSHLGRQRLDTRTIAYPAGDPGALELAARLSHLAGGGTRTAALDAADFDLALEWQSAGALVVAQAQIFPTGCLQLATLLGRAAWLQHAGLDPESADRARSPGQALTAAGIVRPLALSRAWLIAREELAGLWLEFDGTPRLGRLGRAVHEGRVVP